MQKNLLPYRHVLKELLPVYKKGVVESFSKKMAILFNVKDYRGIGTPQEMHDAFFELIEKTYYNLLTPFYEETVYQRIIKPLEDYLKRSLPADVKSIKNRLDESGKISLWYKDEALPYISNAVGVIQTLIPAMIYSCAGISDVTQKGDLMILTISHKEAISLYRNGYETFIHGLKIIVGLNNAFENGAIDVFSQPKVGGVDTITKFASLPGGKMLEHLNGYATITGYLDGALNNKVRNAASHGDGGIGFDGKTQKMTFYYDDLDRTKHYDTSLIDICRMCYLQLLHIIEATMLARRIVEKGI